MAIIVGVPHETVDGETRVAITPTAVAALIKTKVEVLIESGAGVAAGFPDAAYVAKGAKIESRAAVFSNADVLLQVRCTFLDDRPGYAQLERGALVVGFCDPLASPDALKESLKTGGSLISMELIPRITRAQSMDALSSQANIAG